MLLRTRALVVALVVGLVASSGASAGCKRHEAVGSATNLEGRAVDPLANLTSTTVLVFVATSCPISNRYAPEIRRLHEEFAPRGVKFVLVYPSASESAADVAKHVHDYAYPFAAVRDPKHVLVARAGVTVMPEVAVFVPGSAAADRATAGASTTGRSTLARRGPSRRGAISSLPSRP